MLNVHFSFIKVSNVFYHLMTVESSVKQIMFAYFNSVPWLIGSLGETQGMNQQRSSEWSVVECCGVLWSVLHDLLEEQVERNG